MLARSLEPGTVLAGRYRITRPIGAGGMGEVYEAEDLDLGERVALKTMRIEDEATLARFKREVQLARTVTHPNVCRIFDLHRHHDPALIINHVPPALGFATFKEVVNNYGGPKSAVSFKETMKHLDEASRKIADAHLHETMRSSEVLPTAQQVNCGQQLDVLLAEIVRITPKAATATP